MGRKKENDQGKLYSHPVRTRVTEEVFNKLNNLINTTDTRTIGEVTRKILSEERITYYHKDISLNGPMEELASIKKELRSIGININQITRHFNSVPDEQQKIFDALKVLEQYKRVEIKVEHLLAEVSQLGHKWLQK